MRYAVLLIIALLSIDYRMLWDVVARRPELRASLPMRADRVPGFRSFLEGVRARTGKGDSIALIVNAPNVKVYGYGFIRASYLLAGRRLVSLLDVEGRPQPAVANAQYLALFRTEYSGTGTIVWRDREGTLVRQR